MEKEKVTTEVAEKELVTAYIVKRYNNGDIDVEDAKLESTQPISAEAIYEDIEGIARIINLKRIENASFMGIARFYRAAQAQQQAAPEADAE